MFKSHFLGAFCILSIISNVFAIDFQLGHKKFDVSIPDGFTLVNQSSTQKDVTLLEYDYILNDVTTKMLDICFYANQNLTPQYMVDYILTSIKHSGLTIQMLEEHSNENQDYLVYGLLVRASDNNNKYIVFISSVSSSSDLASIVYCIDITPTMTEKQAIEMIKTFALENVKIS